MPLPFDPVLSLALMAMVACFAGVVKGVVGFAMPMIFISGLSIFMPPDVALAVLILPTLATNLWQAARQGWGAAWNTMKQHAGFLVVAYSILLATTQIVPYLSKQLFFLCLGCVVLLFVAVLALGWQPMGRLRAGLRWGCAMLGGFSGGIAGVWGPPTVMYLSTMRLDKTAQMRAQGVIYGVGAVLLAMGHGVSGILNAKTLPLSAMMIIPACFGIWLGFKIQDRINHHAFQTATLIALGLGGLNLLRRGVLG